MVKRGVPSLGLFYSDDSEGKIVVYREHFFRLLAISKPLRDQFMIELLVLEGLRTGEVCTLKVEDVCFESGDSKVLDSKKHRYFFCAVRPRACSSLRCLCSRSKS